MRPVAITALLAAALVGCAAPSPSPRAPAAIAPPAPAADPLAGPWVLRPSTGQRSYTISLGGRLVSRVDTIERADTMHVRLRAAMSRVVGDGNERVSGLVLEFVLSSGDSAAFVAPTGLLAPLPFTARVGIRGAQLELQPPASGECSPAAAALQPLRDLWVGAPSRLMRGQEWEDSTSYTLCRDSIPLAVHAVRRFRVVGAEVHDGEIVVRIERESQARFEGEGRQFGESLRIAAEGSSHLQLLLSLAGGEVVRGEGEAELMMTMTGRRRSQSLRQLTRIAITSP